MLPRRSHPKGERATFSTVNHQVAQIGAQTPGWVRFLASVALPEVDSGKTSPTHRWPRTRRP